MGYIVLAHFVDEGSVTPRFANQHETTTKRTKGGVATHGASKDAPRTYKLERTPAPHTRKRPYDRVRFMGLARILGARKS